MSQQEGGSIPRFFLNPPPKKTLPPQPSDFPASHKAILLNISKKYSLTPSLFIYKNQLNTLLLCSIWKLEQPGLYLAEILLLSPQIPAQPDELEGLRKEGDRGRRGKSHGRDRQCRLPGAQVSTKSEGPGRVGAELLPGLAVIQVQALPIILSLSSPVQASPEEKTRGRNMEKKDPSRNLEPGLERLCKALTKSGGSGFTSHLSSAPQELAAPEEVDVPVTMPCTQIVSVIISHCGLKEISQLLKL